MMQMISSNKHTLVFRNILLMVLFLGYLSHPANAQLPKKKIAKICLDAGHGGKDGGCHGAYSNEKDITLAVALKVENLIKQNMKDVGVVQTRNTDIFWELEERGSIANTNKCD